MPILRAIVFDLDDTLYPERQYALSGFDAVAANYEHVLGPREASSARMRELFDSKQRRKVFDTLLAERGVAPAQLVQAMVSTYRTHAPRITLFSDAEAVLGRLRGMYKLGLITDGPSVMQWAKIDALGLRTRLDHIIVTDDLGPGFAKPHPRAFEQMAERFHVDPAECAYVADNPAKDFVAPRRLGWRTLRVHRPGGVYPTAAAPIDGAPDRVLGSLHELDRML